MGVVAGRSKSGPLLKINGTLLFPREVSGRLVTLDDAGTYITKLPRLSTRPRNGRQRWKP